MDLEKRPFVALSGMLMLMQAAATCREMVSFLFLLKDRTERSALGRNRAVVTTCTGGTQGRRNGTGRRRGGGRRDAFVVCTLSVYRAAV